jgi:hypothetical protein
VGGGGEGCCLAGAVRTLQKVKRYSEDDGLEMLFFKKCLHSNILANFFEVVCQNALGFIQGSGDDGDGKNQSS